MSTTVSYPLNHRSITAWPLLLALPILLANSASASQVFAASASRPFWAEKTSFIEGDELFVVGVASHIRALEEGRQKAFEHGKLELMNFAQVTDLEAHGLIIETQMTYEEMNSDGTITVFRLLRVPVATLVAVQGKLQAQSRAQEQALDQARQEISQLQTTLLEKAQKIDQQQRQVERLLQQMTTQYQLRRPQAGGGALDRLKQAEAQLDEREQELDGIYRRAVERIRVHSQKACKYVMRAMTSSEVRSLLGSPDGSAGSPVLGGMTWTYGTVVVHFDPHDVVSRVLGC